MAGKEKIDEARLICPMPQSLADDIEQERRHFGASIPSRAEVMRTLFAEAIAARKAKRAKAADLRLAKSSYIECHSS